MGAVLRFMTWGQGARRRPTMASYIAAMTARRKRAERIATQRGLDVEDPVIVDEIELSLLIADEILDDHLSAFLAEELKRDGARDGAGDGAV